MSETPVFSTAAVAAPHRLAAETGQTILAAGGNAVEAMVAMAATIAVVYPHMNGVGGDGFWLVREPRGRIHALDASGPAGSLATIKRYREKGYDAIPPRGTDATLTVAGAVSGWGLALELAKALGGQLPLDLLLGDAIRFARDGYPVSRSEERFVTGEESALYEVPGFAAAFLVEGRRAPEGTQRQTPRLADTLERLAHAGLADFYRGDVGREIALDLERIGSPITRKDLETYRARVVEPLSVRLKHSTIYNLPPPSQGLATLLILGMVERLKELRAETPEHHHALIEAAKRAFSLRDRVVADPRNLAHDPSSLLAPQALEREAALIDMKRAASFPLSRPIDGDTIWMGAIDRNGLAVSYIQSVFWAYGSGCLLPVTGVLWHNRGTAFSLDPASRNRLEPGHRPLHSLNPAMAVFDDGRVLSFGAMGGETQPQFLSQIFSRYAEAGMGLADAVEAPRWLLDAKPREREAVLKVESHFDPGLIRGLSRFGHRIEEMDEAYSGRFGHAGMLVKHPRNGRVEAVHDPRSDGGSLGL
ncbi:gamma-glutamyltransferase family protein [Microvirga tunisiensis]|uniref:Gamma-glutamyltransferase n=1 Tax=Microvirga tunisiensis TaxID=2108360 RepID=A0A5N7MDK4_9HYPH|nr:gamma-glutamyltransferase [Microvirga tunisiensis]MPR06835.1 gamma-glutamyltransferase [Microvirga tunisiensis]MPR25001.1 gamma-glutamyltransferase [Microvirga tunisiensis]